MTASQQFANLVAAEVKRGIPYADAWANCKAFGKGKELYAEMANAGSSSGAKKGWETRKSASHARHHGEMAEINEDEEVSKKAYLASKKAYESGSYEDHAAAAEAHKFAADRTQYEYRANEHDQYGSRHNRIANKIQIDLPNAANGAPIGNKNAAGHKWGKWGNEDSHEVSHHAPTNKTALIETKPVRGRFHATVLHPGQVSATGATTKLSHPNLDELRKHTEAALRGDTSLSGDKNLKSKYERE